MNKTLSLPEKFQLMLDLGLWAPDIGLPDPQILERIERLEQDIEKQTIQLYLPPTNKEQAIERIKATLKKKRTPARPKKITTKDPSHFSFLGEGVSTWLAFHDEDSDALDKIGLPSLPSAQAVANFLHISIQKLKNICFHRTVTSSPDYLEFLLPKKSGGHRVIDCPKEMLRSIHFSIKSEILDKIVFPEYVHGFVKGHNILDNALPHSNAKVLINIDIQDFFGSITFNQVRYAFHDLGYSGEVSTILALLTTKPKYIPVETAKGKKWFCTSNRYLPQGAATSPCISNLVAKKFDSQLYLRSKKLGYTYTRYADDLSFSSRKKMKNINTLLYMARKTLELHGFKANPNKTKVLYKSNQQNVTGLVVNSKKPRIPREWRRKIRAAVHQFKFIEDEELKRQEYYRIKGCIEFLKLGHKRLAQQYDVELSYYYNPS